MELSACIEWLFAAEYPAIADRIRASREAGLAGVELHLWRDKPLEPIRAALEDSGLSLNALVVDPRCRLADPAALPGFRQAIRDTLETARYLGARYVIPSVGLALPEVPIGIQRQTIVTALRHAVEAAEGSGVGLLIEPVNSRVDHPGMYLSSTREALSLIEQVGAPTLQLLFDFYHALTMGEALEPLLPELSARLGYVQVADSPGRHEPGSGRIDWPRCLAWLERTGYQGPIGLEYKPRGATFDSLALTRRTLGLPA